MISTGVVMLDNDLCGYGEVHDEYLLACPLVSKCETDRLYTNIDSEVIEICLNTGVVFVFIIYYVV